MQCQGNVGGSSLGCCLNFTEVEVMIFSYCWRHGFLIRSSLQNFSRNGQKLIQKTNLNIYSSFFFFCNMWTWVVYNFYIVFFLSCFHCEFVTWWNSTLTKGWGGGGKLLWTVLEDDSLSFKSWANNIRLNTFLILIQWLDV